ncbi:hypothetical protein MPSEU_001096300 [Mayamaea pseudoterrestris]|nr:hypothetical protein MPSEU_001096300 [Mayamaea pseudoterrestris]
MRSSNTALHSPSIMNSTGKQIMLIVLFCLLLDSSHAWVGGVRVSAAATTQAHRHDHSTTFLSAFSEGTPSDTADYNTLPIKQAVVDLNEQDAYVRDALKRELLILASVTDRGEYSTKDEQNILVDLISQLEALNPTANPASNCQGEWDLCLSSTQFFRSSPFFQSMRVAAGDENKAVAINFFDLHDKATSASRYGRVRQRISRDKLISEVDLVVGLLPGIPMRIQGTVVTESNLKVVSAETMEVSVVSTQVNGSNVPLLNQFLDDLKFELPVGDVYRTIQGNVPVVPLRTFYVDEAIRIMRDIDDNFFVFTRA